MEIKSPLLAVAISLMLGLATSSQATITCTQDYEVCFTDHFGVTFKVVQGSYPLVTAIDDSPLYYDFGNLAGFMEIPKGLTGTVEDITCPLRGSHLKIGPGVTPDTKRVQIGLYSDCFCEEGANPAHRIFQIDVDVDGKPVGPAQPMTSHIYRCNNTYVVWSQGEPDYIGPATSIPPYDSISPDWDRESPY